MYNRLNIINDLNEAFYLAHPSVKRRLWIATRGVTDPHKRWMIMASLAQNSIWCGGPPRNYDDFFAGCGAYRVADDPPTHEDDFNCVDELDPMLHPFSYRFTYAAGGERCAA